MLAKPSKLSFALSLVASGMLLCSAPTLIAQTAGQDMHQAGTSSKHAAQKTGRGVKKGTHTTYKKTSHGATTGYNKTKEGTTKGYDRTKEGTQHVFGMHGQSSTKAKDRSKEERQKLDDTSPR